jgi:hypothetical protein
MESHGSAEQDKDVRSFGGIDFNIKKLNDRSGTARFMAGTSSGAA